MVNTLLSQSTLLHTALISSICSPSIPHTSYLYMYGYRKHLYIVSHCPSLYMTQLLVKPLGSTHYCYADHLIIIIIIIFIKIAILQYAIMYTIEMEPLRRCRLVCVINNVKHIQLSNSKIVLVF